MDFISALPDNLIETILIKVPLLDAVQTCILSKRWRYSWLKLPHLDFDATFWKQSLALCEYYEAADFLVILFRILLLHQGPITSISVRVPKLEHTPEIDTLIAFIVRNGVQECTLLLAPLGRYKLNSTLFTYPTLIQLYLASCEVNFIPSTSEGFRNLTRLILIDVLISAEVLGSLVSSCPSLQTLHLKISLDISCLQINAPKLVNFICYYSNSSQLSRVVNSQQQDSILRLLGKFPNLDYLYMDGHYVKSVVAGLIPTRVSTVMFHCLKYIQLVSIHLEDVDQFSSVLCLVRSSPNLKSLRVHRKVSYYNNMDDLQEEEDYSDLTPNHLVEVVMLSVVGGRLELKLIRILLEKSPSLRKMTIGLDTSRMADNGLKIIKEMLVFRRASPNLEVYIKD